MLRLTIAAILVAAAGVSALGPACDPGCVDKYKMTYGCFVHEVDLPSDNECFSSVGVGQGGCLTAECSLPNSMTINMPYCAPGCNSSLVGDGVCDTECLSPDCGLDGGDCMKDPIFSYSALHMLVSDFDVDFDHRLNFSEYQAMVLGFNATNMTNTTYNLPIWEESDVFEKYLSRGEAGVSMFQLGLLLANELPGAMHEPQGAAPTHAVALKLVWMADKDLDGRVSGAEAMEAFGAEMDLYDKLFGEWTVKDIADDLESWFDLLQGGADVEDDFFENAIRASFLFDFNGDHMLDMHESTLLTLGPLFQWLDLNADGMIDMEEMRLVIMTMKADACDGAELLTEREGEIHSKIPLPGMHPITCAWLIQPRYYYWAPYTAAPSAPLEPLVRRSGSAAVGAQKLRARVDKETGKVITLPTRHVGDNALRAKEHTLRTEDAAKTRAFEGMTVTDATAYEFVVSIEFYSTQICAGALVRADTVLTTAWCVHEIMAAMEQDPTGLAARIGSTQINTGGEVMEIVAAVAHPHYDVDGGFDVGAVRLGADSGMRPASMYDGGDLGINDCTRMTMSYLGWGPEGVLKRAGMGLFNYDECKDMYHWATGMEVVGPEELCAKTKVAEGMVDCQSVAAGAPLFVRLPTEPNVTKLVGVGSLSEGCAGAGFPALFTRTSSVLQWVMSVWDMGVHPANKIELTVKELGLPKDSKVDVYAGSWASMETHIEMLDSKCQVPKTLTDEGTGSLLLVLTVAPFNNSECDDECFGHLGMDAEYSLIGCADNFRTTMGETQPECDQPEAGGIAGCVFETGPDGPGCHAPAAPMTVPWSRLGPMEDEGKVYSGGLGKRAVKTFDAEYGVWTCIRDWSSEEQLACGARTGELCCYWFEEKSRRWDFQGLNGEVKLVREAEWERGMEVEARRLEGRTLRTSPNQMH